MSAAPSTGLIKRSYASMQISIDDDGVHLTITPLDDLGQPIFNPVTKRSGAQISLTTQEAIDIGDVWSGLRFETDALFNGKPVLPHPERILTCTNCFGRGCSSCDNNGYVCRGDYE